MPRNTAASTPSGAGEPPKIAMTPAVSESPVKTLHAPSRKPAPFDSPPREIDFGRMQLDLAFSPEDLKSKAMSGVVTHRVRPRRDGVTSISLDALGLKIASVEIGAERLTADFAHDGKVLAITLPKAAKKGEELSLRISYRVEAPPLGLHFVGEPPDDDFTVYSNGEPLQARYWLPCHDWPDSRWTGCDVRITVPKGLTVVSVGDPVGSPVDSADGAATTFAWRLDVPIDPHLLGFSIGKYKEIVVENGRTPISFFTQAEYESEAREAFADASAALTHFSKITGVDYPFPRFSHVVVPNHFHGGMEHAGFNMIAPRMFAGNPRGDWVRFGYLAHMMAHQWFAGLVNYRHITEAWVNEGFGSYLHLLWMREQRGEDAFRAEMRRVRDIVLRFDIAGKSHPMVNTEIAKPEDIYGFGGGLVYWKGAWVLHMLRAELGDEVFWRGVREYLTKHRFGDAETSDLRTAFEAASRRDLSAFFKQWVWRDGTPRVKVRWKWDAAAQSVAVEVEQTQLVDATHPVFEFPLDLSIEAGETPIRKSLTINAATQRFDIPAPERPKRVIADPDQRLLASIGMYGEQSATQPASSPGEEVAAEAK